MAWSEVRPLYEGYVNAKSGSIGDQQGPGYSRRIELWSESGGTLTEATIAALKTEATLAIGTAHPNEATHFIKRVTVVPRGKDGTIAYARVIIDYQQLPPGFA